MYGELVPLGGGDPIPLLKKELLVGRRESCDIVLRFANVSAHHCQLFIQGGYWFIRDMQSRNGCKVNGIRVSEKRIDPGAALAIAKHHYKLHYSPVDLGATGPPPADDLPAELMTESLLSRAGLQSTKSKPACAAGATGSKRSTRSGNKVAGNKAGVATQPESQDDDSIISRYDVLDDSAGQIKLPDKPL
ncbi:MAG: FHA domain-containing protein [Pirellulales bacterium]